MVKKYVWNHRFLSEGVSPDSTERSNTSLETQALKRGKTQIFLEENSLWERYTVK